MDTYRAIKSGPGFLFGELFFPTASPYEGFHYEPAGRSFPAFTEEQILRHPEYFEPFQPKLRAKPRKRAA